MIPGRKLDRYAQAQWELSFECITVRNTSIWFAGSTDPDQTSSHCAGGRNIGCECLALG
jgi:hypothetical protein